MRKGDEKRQDILAAAEKLFCSRGYDATSVQDILNVLHASKGGFYHHFASKEEVLKTLCSQRAERAASYTAQLLEQAAPGMGRINAVLHGYMPLRREEAAFVRLLLPMIEASEGRTMAIIYQDALFASFLPLLQEEVAKAAAAEIICPPVKEMEAVILHVVDQCWLEVTALLMRVVRGEQRYDTSSVLGILEKYRRAIEVLMDAPFGSIEMIRIEEWEQVCHQLLRAMES